MAFKITLLLLPVCLLSCLSQKKHEEILARYDTALDMVIDSLDMMKAIAQRQADSLSYERGGNAYLMQAQNELRDQLVEQARSMDQLQGNLNNTQQSLQNRIAQLDQQLGACRMGQDSLRLSASQVLHAYNRPAHLAVDQLMGQLQAHLAERYPLLEIRKGTGAARLIVPVALLFRVGHSPRLTEDAAIILAAVARALESDPLLKLRIEAHTDNRTSQTNSWALAAQQATRICSSLTDDYYLGGHRLTAVSAGEYAPSQSNATAEGRAANQRVEFVLYTEARLLTRSLEAILQTETGQ